MDTDQVIRHFSGPKESLANANLLRDYNKGTKGFF